MKTLITLFLVLSSLSVYALDVPKLLAPITDQAGLLSSQVRESLNAALYNVKKETGSEIAVLTVKSLEGESIEGYAMKVADQWKLGSEKKDNGVLFLIALGEKQMRIEVGQGHEGDIPDAKAGHIISGVKTYFKRGDFQSGVILGVDQIAKNIGATLKDTPKVSNKGARKGGSTLLFFVIIILSFLFGGRRGGGGLLAGLMLGSAMGGGSRSSYGGSGGFGGGSFGGGGGGFSGGGASGGW